MSCTLGPHSDITEITLPNTIKKNKLKVPHETFSEFNITRFCQSYFLFSLFILFSFLAYICSNVGKFAPLKLYQQFLFSVYPWTYRQLSLSILIQSMPGWVFAVESYAHGQELQHPQFRERKALMAGRDGRHVFHSAMPSVGPAWAIMS